MLPVNRRLTATINAPLLGPGNTLHLPLAPQVDSKFSEYAKHIEEGFARWG